MSPVANQIMSNTVFAMHDVMQMCFVGVLIQIEWAVVTESVALFTFYSVQNAVSLVEEHTQE